MAKRCAAAFSERWRNASSDSSRSPSTRRSSSPRSPGVSQFASKPAGARGRPRKSAPPRSLRSEEHTSELQSRGHLVCRLLLEKKKKKKIINYSKTNNKDSNRI